MVTEAQKRATKKYVKEHIKRIPLNVSKEDYEKIKKAADKIGISVNGFIKDAVFDWIDEHSGYINREL